MTVLYSKLKKALGRPSLIAIHLLNKLAPIFPDKLFLKLKYRLVMGRRLDLDNPQTYNEKLQWLKLYDRRIEYTTMVDKFAAKEYVSEKIGNEFVIPTYGIWDKFDEINFEKLPNQFVLKCTHDSGGVVVCKDKRLLDYSLAKKKIERCLKNNYYYRSMEWPYKNVPKKIIAEQYMSDSTENNRGGLTDYKFYCFNGKAYKVMLCLDRDKGDTKFYSFDKKWNLLRHNKRGLAAPENFTLPKPSQIDEMFEIAELLSIGIPFVRVDLYFVHNQIYFGELTFYPDSGFDYNILPEIDRLYGSMIELPTKCSV